MVVNKNELIKLFEQLPEDAQQSAYDYILYLLNRYRPDWDDIALMEPDDIPLSEEEERQLNAKEGFVTGEEAKRGFKLQVDLP